mmetsp:Transcript_148461/g.476830  ORF Transcript_148461/g.476830 Transcript_148461/m.476830 type:complete len:330 (-) Transcript_148461:199-1188(-)
MSAASLSASVALGFRRRRKGGLIGLCVLVVAGVCGSLGVRSHGRCCDGPDDLAFAFGGRRARRLASRVLVSRPAGPGAATGVREAKADLLKAIVSFKHIQSEVGTASVDFGVKGGELDKGSRAPRNLAADGAFYRISEELGQAADRVLDAAKGMKALNPDPEPLKLFATPEGKRCALHGTWKLLFTTAADATFSKNSSRGDASVCNVVDAVAGTVTNCIDFAVGDTPPVLEKLRVQLTATAESGDRLALVFRYVKATITKFFGIPLGGRGWTLTFPVPAPFISRVIQVFTGKAPPKPYFDVLYLDESLRIHETGEGNIFVQMKAPDDVE